MYVSTIARLKSNQGFSLLELMIVIVIVGLLATIGVPGYKKMVQKSRKAEAQTLLGGILKAEQAFHAEYGSYGNNLANMGISMPDNSNTIYRAGFTANNGSCESAALYPATIYKYSSWANNHVSTLGRMSQTVCYDGSSVTADNFKIYATGYIRSVSDTAPRDACDTGIDDCDVWSIDEEGNLDNVQDGIQ